ncbi:hypothetical protein [Brevifollis gellanilyticus]|uniref:Uncharacterized protein n=1 Tax=Brevifollis gellanilyticus TaxID=748831 RepID=A0A512M943_9BACT|nr:hypothetical protein [Brevifollis gellanilyticus]GEP43242.1 hypothetical protein BGE01nite_25330 [Brevifollis gellanilyticus]
MEQTTTTTPPLGNTPISFEGQIKALFRPFDRNSMLSRFDLWSYTDVKAWAQPIYEQVSQGNMPCDDPWSQDYIDLFKAWMDGGMQP